jgi:hypothetical protein
MPRSGNQSNVARQRSQNAAATWQLDGPFLNRNLVDLEKARHNI